MNNGDFYFDKSVKDKLDDLVVQPSPQVWQAISDEISRRNRQKRIVLYRMIGLAASLLLAFVAGWYFKSLNNSPSLVAEKAIAPQQNEKASVEKKSMNKENEVLNLIDNNKVTISSESSHKISEFSGNQVAPNKETLVQREAFQMAPARRIDGYIRQSYQENQLLAEKTTVAETELSTLSSDDALTIENNRKSLSPSVNHWKVGMHVSPGYSSYKADHNALYAQNMSFRSSSGDNNVGGGLSLQYKTGKRWSIESGLYYSRNGERTGQNNQYAYANSLKDYTPTFAGNVVNSAPVNLSGGNLIMNSTAGIIKLKGTPANTELAADVEKAGNFSNSIMIPGEVNQVFNFMEVPVYLRYTLIDSKIDVQMLGGLNANFLVGNNAYITNGAKSENIGKTEDVRQVSYSGTVGIGVSYNLFKNLSLSVEPRLNYSLSSLNSNPSVDFKPYRVGIFTGVNYDF